MIPRIDVSGLTSVGRVRPSNEDQFLIASLQKSMMVLQTSLAHDDHSRLIGAIQGHVFAVADGMGGHTGGARASRIAVGTVVRYILNTMPWFFRLDERIPDDLEHELAATLRSCQRSIETVAGEHPEVRDMGTTLTMAYLLWPRMYIVHAVAWSWKSVAGNPRGSLSHHPLSTIAPPFSGERDADSSGRAGLKSSRTWIFPMMVAIPGIVRR